ncbi:hypothetical protein GDO86_010641 [Hymenochirus boettgeri]|uniref:Dynein regulatory complex protein 1 n=1 Tax=Hymenochirus boettgeri TaxID=247094 RepID=A0A8T2JL75_9PIPI|nr:hypothetical protein GDO86_010641 [Hymenochirus boettgeri]
MGSNEQTGHLRKSHKQIEDSQQRLGKLVSDGSQLVTNIQIASDAREMRRRAEEDELKRLRQEKLNTEAKTSLEKFEEITKKWTQNKPRQAAHELWVVLNSQQQLCAHLIEEKNWLVGELQKELKRKDEQYVKDLKRQGEDIDLLVERMEEQVRSLTKAYRQELLQIEKAFELERTKLLNVHVKKWEQGMQSRRDKELEGLMNRMKKVEEYEHQLKQLRVQDGEEYNRVKIKQETEVQLLQQQLQQMKATYQLNQEKLEYNFQVLKKRDEENTITKSQQKRKITRLQDVLNNLKLKQAKQIKQYKEENQSLADDYMRIVEQYKDLQKKMWHFDVVETKMFEDIWLMNEEEVKKLMQKALEADRIIQEQQLGLPWEAPNLWFMDNVGPLVAKPKTQKSATKLAQEVMSSTGQDVLGGSHHETHQTERFSVQTIKHVLELLCDESGFLIEDKVVRLLSPLDKDEQSLIKLDSIFGALGIEVEDDVYKLVDFFQKYKQEQIRSEKDKVEMREPSNIGNPVESQSAPSTGDLVHSNDVLTALKAFVKEIQKPREKMAHGPVEERDNSEDAAYWAAIAQVIPDSRLRVWDALESALEKYYNILNRRSELITETSSLRQQNTELSSLLHQYMNSKINSELEIPPTQMMQVEYSHS